jgi:glycosyltransferase involved in cell wall biosynthesis
VESFIKIRRSGISTATLPVEALLPATDTPRLSVVVPLLNEEENVGILIERIQDVLASHIPWELILVDDGSQDRTAELALRRAAEDPRVRLLRLARRYGQSTAMQAGFDHARGEVVVTMDGDLQNDPQDILALVEKLEEGYDLVAGYRVQRQDTFVTRKVPSWIANRIIRYITDVDIRDNGCSLKAYQAPLLSRIRLYSDMHRFIPALAAGAAGALITEVPVRHHPRTRGTSKYGLSRVFMVLMDLLTIKMIRSFRDRPLRLFSAMAGMSALLSLLFVAASLLAALTFQEYKALSLVFPTVAALWLTLAASLLLLGLVGEVAVRQHKNSLLTPGPLAREIAP